jgi:hypothetical protein
VVDEHEPARADPGDLAAQLGADRAAGARHHHHAAREVLADALDLHAHGLAAEHVLHADLADLADQAAGGVGGGSPQQLEDGRHRPHGHAALAAGGDHPGAHGARRRRDRDQHLVGLDVLEHPAELLGRAEHLEAVDPRAALARVVVDEADGPVPERRVAQDLLEQHPAAVPRADDEHRARAGLGPVAPQRPVVDGLHGEADAAQQAEEEQPEEHDDARGGVDGDEAPAAREDLHGLEDDDVGDEPERS